MATGLTPIYLIPYPLSTDPVNVHGDIEDLAFQFEDTMSLKVDKNLTNILTKTNTYTLTGTDNGIIINQAGSGVPLRITNTGTGNSFLVEDSSSTDTTPFVIDASGQVGIGKTVPTVLLDVAGIGAFSGALTASTFNALFLTSNSTGYTISGGTTAVGVTFAGGSAYTLSGTNGTTITLPATTGTLDLNVTTTLGDLVYASANGTPGTTTRLPGNTTTTKQFLNQTGNGTISAAPVWSAIANADVPTALTGKSYNGLTLTSTTGTFTLDALKTFTVNNTLTLSGTDSSTLNIGTGGTLGTAAYTASSAYEPAITTLAISSGGTGTGTAPTQYGVIYASSATTYASTGAGTAGQVLTVNGTANGYIWSSPLTNPMTTAGDIIYGGASGVTTRLAGSATNGYILTYDTTTNAPYWAVAPAGYSAPTLGSTSIASGATVSNINALTINSTTIPTSATLLTSGGALGTPASGTLTNATGLPIAGLVASTTTALGVGSIELGHATDTTISRASAGVVNIEGVPIVTTTATQTLTNKTLTAPLTVQSSGGVPLFLFQNDLNGNLEIGRTDGTASTPYIDFHSGATAVDYDARIIAQHPTGVSGQGSLTIDGNLLQNINTVAKTAAYTLVMGDANKLIQMNGAFAFTVPLNSTVAYPTGTTINLIALTAGVSVVFTGGITSYATPGLKLRAAGSMATLIKLNTDTWALSGDLTA